MNHSKSKMALMAAAALLFSSVSFSLSAQNQTAGQEQQTHSLTVEIKGIDAKYGNLMAAVYDKEGFLKKPVAKRKLYLNGKNKESVKIVFDSLTEGEYSVAVFLDQNGNSRMDYDAMGVPVEMLGFSNDVELSFGPPAFREASFKLVSDKEIAVTIYQFGI